MKAKFTCEISEGFPESPLTLTCDLEWDAEDQVWRAHRNGREAFASNPAEAALDLFRSLLRPLEDR
jgi:hypothetical protein